MNMELYEEILFERLNQEAKHPRLPKYFLHPESKQENKHDIKTRLAQIQRDNDMRDLDNQESWYGILTEELLEIFAESKPDRIRTELIQSIALQVRMVEMIDRDKIKR